jgi:hypothetical protein
MEIRISTFQACQQSLPSQNTPALAQIETKSTKKTISDLAKIHHKILRNCMEKQYEACTCHASN